MPNHTCFPSSKLGSYYTRNKSPPHMGFAQGIRCQDVRCCSSGYIGPWKAPVVLSDAKGRFLTPKLGYVSDWNGWNLVFCDKSIWPRTSEYNRENVGFLTLSDLICRLRGKTFSYVSLHKRPFRLDSPRTYVPVSTCLYLSGIFKGFQRFLAVFTTYFTT